MDFENINKEFNEIWEKVKKETPGGIKKQVEKLEEVLENKLKVMQNVTRIDLQYYYAHQAFLRDKKRLVK